jgi:hypothetical protein
MQGAPAEPAKKKVAPVAADEGEMAKDLSEEEEVELTEEEMEEFLDSLSEEELEELLESLESEDDEEVIEEEEEVSEEDVVSEESSEEELEEARKAAVKKMVDDSVSSCNEDIDALFSGETLSEEFKSKATTIFEAAVHARVSTIAETLVSENEQIVSEMVEQIQEQLSDQVDEYLNYVVENWMEENKLAVETGIRTEIAEEFMAGLKELFEQHYIEVPEDKVDIVEEMAERVLAAEEAMELQAQELSEAISALNESKSKEILRKTCDGLTEMQVEKIRALAEGVEFTTEGEYAEKLAVIRESYFPSKANMTRSSPDIVVETEEQKQTIGTMDHYVKAITKSLNK